MPLLWTLEDDLWNIDFSPGWLKYAYVLTGKPVKGIASCFSFLDRAGRLHLLLRTTAGSNIYAYWQGRSWEVLGLPYHSQDGTEPYGLAVDCFGRGHILLRWGRGRVFHLTYQEKECLIRELPFALSSEPLCFTPGNNEGLFLSWQEVGGGMQQILSSLYTPKAGWTAPSLLGREKKDATVYFYPPDGSRLYWLVWEPQDSGYHVYHCSREKKGCPSRKEYLGEVLGLPDRPPLRLTLGSTILLCWTAKGKFTFCLGDFHGTSWSPVQDDYLFFPARLEGVTGWSGFHKNKVAFTKISGLDLHWPLILTVEQILPYCRALLCRG
ncbi:MAG TPA: hypothetical protein DEA73_06480 [Peptococcaceae bacterium]|nr:hypothetical protein [Peptococcaceae bacterium]